MGVDRPMAALLAGLAAMALLACGSEAPQPERIGFYWVQSGDTLSAIAERFDADGGYPRLASLNTLDDPHRLRVGQVVAVPWRGELPAGLYETLDLPSRAAARVEPRTCPDLTRWPTDAPPPESAECYRPECVAADGRRVCLCQRAEGSALLVDGHGEVPLPDLGTSVRFEVWSAPLGAPHTLISVRLSVSNGIALPDWMHLIVTDQSIMSFRSIFAR